MSARKPTGQAQPQKARPSTTVAPMKMPTGNSAGSHLPWLKMRPRDRRQRVGDGEGAGPGHGNGVLEVEEDEDESRKESRLYQWPQS